jgi:hypothetical protein
MNDGFAGAILGEVSCLADREDDENVFSYISVIFG